MHFLIYIFAYLVIILITIYLSKYFNLYDIPNRRKVHQIKILNTSGLSLFFFCILVVLLSNFPTKIKEIFIASSFITLIGFIDDRVNLKASYKLIFIFLPTAYLIIFNGFYLENLGDYEIIGTIGLGSAGIIITFLCVGVLLNSYNYIDGIDGLLSSTSVITLIYLSFLVKDDVLINLFSLISIPLIINLIFNYLPYKSTFKTFMGNCGSLFVGFILSFIIIYIFKYKYIHPSYLIWSCWYAVYDFLFVTFYRILKKKTFFKADKIHFHHFLLSLFKESHFKSFLVINIFNIIIIGLGYSISKFYGNLESLISFVFFFIIFFIFRFIIYLKIPPQT